MMPKQLSKQWLKEFKKALENPKFNYTPPKEFKPPYWIKPSQGHQYDMFQVLAESRRA